MSTGVSISEHRGRPGQRETQASHTLNQLPNIPLYNNHSNQPSSTPSWRSKKAPSSWFKVSTTNLDDSEMASRGKQRNRSKSNESKNSAFALHQAQRSSTAALSAVSISQIYRTRDIGSANTGEGRVMRSAMELSTSSNLGFGGPHTFSGRPSRPQSENGSLLSRTIRERMREMGNPLRGPVLTQMAVHYIYFAVLMALAYALGWAPNIRVYSSILWANMSFFSIQISRLYLEANPMSLAPFYISFFPFGFLIIISREAHIIVMVMWYVSILVIFLQLGHHELQRHIFIYSILFLGLYCACVVFMLYFYGSTNNFFSGVELSPPIRFDQEIVFVVGCAAVMGAIFQLEHFVKLNAITLLDRESYMNQLYVANIDLRRQLRKAKSDKEVDLEAPLSRAQEILKDVKSSPEIDELSAKELEMIVEILASDQLYSVNLREQPADADVQDWLSNMLMNQEHKFPTLPGSIKTSGSLSSMDSTAVVTASNTAANSGISTPWIKKNGFLTSDETAIFTLLDNVEDIQFDIFELDRMSNHRPLHYISWYLFRKHDLFEKFKIPEAKFRHWITKVEQGYKPTNPYHNSVHAADVTHSMHFYVTRPRLWDRLSSEERLATLIAPIIHDYMHPGVNNAFLISTMNPLSLRYNDQSVLEHFHCASVFELMSREEYNILASMTPDCRKQVRDLVISMVLATDMAMHFEWIGKFKNKLNGPGFNFDIRADRKLVLNMAIKCSDVNNPAKRLDQCKKWTELIMEEFFAQGDEERRRGVPVSMFMNRETTDIPKCQIGFIEFIVQPLFEAWSGFMQEDAAIVMANIQNNKQYWKTKAERQVSVVVPPTISRAMKNTTSESAAEEVATVNTKLSSQQNRAAPSSGSRAISLASELDQSKPELPPSQFDRPPGQKPVVDVPSGPSLLATSLSVATTPGIRNQR